MNLTPYRLQLENSQSMSVTKTAIRVHIISHIHNKLRLNKSNNPYFINRFLHSSLSNPLPDEADCVTLLHQLRVDR